MPPPVLLMKTSVFLACGAALLLATTAPAQLSVPLSDISLAYPSAPAITVKLGATSRAILPTPFVIDGAYAGSALWFCMDPLQTIFFDGSGQPPGSSLLYDSDQPTFYDKWTGSAPGLSAARLQDLADLFTAVPLNPSNLSLVAALQLVVPEITNEFDGNGYSLFSGKFTASGGANAAANSIVNLAESILASLDTPGVKDRGNVQGLRFLIDGRYGSTPVQDLVGFVPVPEPSTYALFGVALLVPAIVLRRRRLRRDRP